MSALLNLEDMNVVSEVSPLNRTKDYRKECNECL